MLPVFSILTLFLMKAWLIIFKKSSAPTLKSCIWILKQLRQPSTSFYLRWRPIQWMLLYLIKHGCEIKRNCLDGYATEFCHRVATRGRGGGGVCLHKREHCLGLGRTKDKVETSLFWEPRNLSKSCHQLTTPSATYLSLCRQKLLYRD